MALQYGIRAIAQSPDPNLPHVLAFQTPRAVAGDTLFEVWNGPTNASRVYKLGLGGEHRGAEGTEAAPAYSFGTDPDSGLYRIGADNLGLSLGGVKRADFQATQFLFSVPLLPSASSTYSLGSSTARWNNVYAVGGDFAGNVVVGGTLGVTGLITGTLATAAQPNVTSLGTLTALTVTGSIDALNGLNLGAGGAQGIVSWGAQGPYLRGAAGKGAGLYGGGGANGITVDATGAVSFSSVVSGVGASWSAASEAVRLTGSAAYITFVPGGSVRRGYIQQNTSEILIATENSARFRWDLAGPMLINHLTDTGAVAGDLVLASGKSVRWALNGGGGMATAIYTDGSDRLSFALNNKELSLYQALTSGAALGAYQGKVAANIGGTTVYIPYYL